MGYWEIVLYIEVKKAQKWEYSLLKSTFQYSIIPLFHV